ncbi:uracil-DNA glycosylase family protein [Shewanella schlegeliana]|uniref:Uracil-DNA glycosylase family protein n=1 Tax=Shewanella schlegeliana TaxID=190308 RepID=A0ABS1SXK1_9GAMM|nr:uracil-DNA glycosylase family protein [Shewanella schlegeliana]MBL4913276.1 uracil-DNA glycosylase family protein [Shewanella schlegeliana]MCL1109231.1 uracil-DNA glycosylase family protein [Shewanella schlegeliana]GIU24482.1 uracil-DNA glycosylase family protein [Shewanella schlegeliana]
MSNENSFITLKAEIAQCQLCKEFLPLGAKPIIQLDKQAKILIAGQAPGQKTHHKGRPFDDASGERLRTWLGVTREQFYDPELFAIVPMGFCYPGSYTTTDKQSGDKPPRPECANKWRQQVLDQLEHIELTLLVGKYAIEWHLQQRLSVSQSVANWQVLWPNTLVMPHPSPRNNIWLKRHPEFEQQIIPQLQRRVASLINSA